MQEIKSHKKRVLKAKANQIAYNFEAWTRQRILGKRNISELKVKVKIDTTMHRFVSPSKIMSPLAKLQNKKFPKIQRQNVTQVQFHHKIKLKQFAKTKLNWIENIPKCKAIICLNLPKFFQFEIRIYCLIYIFVT